MSGKLERPRKRMDRRELKRAARIIARLVRSKPDMPRKRKQLDAVPEGYRQTIHVSCNVTALRNLDSVIEIMKGDPVASQIKAQPGREHAMLYALAQFLQGRAPERVTKQRASR